MAANTSRRKLHSAVIALQVGELTGAVLVVDCGRCGPRRLALSPDHAGATLARFLFRLRCRGCGRGAAAAALDNGMQGWRRQVVRVWGPGSYG